jgi:hypothetical protein
MNSSLDATSLPVWSVRPLRAEDERRWRELCAGYAAFYGIDQTEEMASRVWGWLLAPDQGVEGIVVVDDGAPFKDLPTSVISPALRPRRSAAISTICLSIRGSAAAARLIRSSPSSGGSETSAAGR